MNAFTVYDQNDQTTWPPGAGHDVLVCYRDNHGELVWTIGWSEYGPDHDHAAMLDHGADWADLDIQRSPWVAWRPLNAETDAPTDEAAELLAGYYQQEACTADEPTADQLNAIADFFDRDDAR